MGFVKHLPNTLSMSRIAFLFLTSTILFTDYDRKYTTALMLFSLGSITDYLDGKVARHFHVVSRFGILFDAIADKILTIGIFITFLALGIYPPSYVFAVLIILTREFLISGLRMIAAKEGIVLAAEMTGKIKTAVQMVAACVSLGSRSFREFGLPEIICVGLDKLGSWAFLVSAFLAATSGFSYFRKYGHLMLEDTPQSGQKKAE